MNMAEKDLPRKMVIWQFGLTPETSHELCNWSLLIFDQTGTGVLLLLHSMSALSWLQRWCQPMDTPGIHPARPVIIICWNFIIVVRSRMGSVSSTKNLLPFWNWATLKQMFMRLKVRALTSPMSRAPITPLLSMENCWLSSCCHSGHKEEGCGITQTRMWTSVI